jgi:hypothetical protein
MGSISETTNAPALMKGIFPEGDMLSALDLLRGKIRYEFGPHSTSTKTFSNSYQLILNISVVDPDPKLDLNLTKKTSTKLAI